MKILSISNMSIWPWGEGKGIPSIFFTQREFVKKGCEVHFLCPVQENEPRVSDSEGICVYRFNFPFNFRRGAYMQSDTLLSRLKGTLFSNFNWLFLQIFLFLRGLKIARAVRPDIIYAHSCTSVFPAYLVSMLVKSKFIVRVYGTRQLYWRWPNIWYRIKECRDYLTFKVPADYFIFTSDGSLGDRLAVKLGVTESKIRSWRNGLEETFYEQEHDARQKLCERLNINPAFKIIASTSRLVTEYGADTLVCSLTDVFRDNPDTVCIIAGNGPEKSRLEKFAAAEGISDRILFLGIVDRSMIKQILCAADIFVFMSRYHNCTNTMWEAMAAGSCIVTADNDGIREVLTSGENAVLVPPHEFRQLPEIISGLLSNNRLREELGRNARTRAGQVLETWSMRIEKEFDLFEGLVDSGQRNRGNKKEAEVHAYEI